MKEQIRQSGKKWVLAAAAVLLTPVVLFGLLTVLIYLPPVQNWVVDKVAAYASEKTGMQISIDHVDLEFPLDLGIDGFRVKGPEGAFIDVERMVVDVELLPLLRSRVVIDELEIRNTKLNTADLMASMRLKGQLERLFLTSRGIDLDQQTVDLNGATLDGAVIDIAMNDTIVPEEPDTTKTLWKIFADSLTVNRSQVAFHMPGDTMSVKAYLGWASAYTGVVDLEQQCYTVQRFVVRDGTLDYDQNYEPAVDGFDYNHIALTGVGIDIDSIVVKAPLSSPEGDTNVQGAAKASPRGGLEGASSGDEGGAFSLYLNVNRIAMRDKSGLEITELRGPFSMDSTGISLPKAVLRTPDSDIEAEFRVQNSLYLRLNAQLGKQDLLRFMGGLPQQMQQRWPNQPLTIRGSLNGNMQQADFTGLLIDLPGALHLQADGTVANATDMSQLKADVQLHGRTENLDFLTSAYGIPNAQIRIPRGITVDGRLKAEPVTRREVRGTRYDVDLTAREGGGTVKAKGFVQQNSNLKSQRSNQTSNLKSQISNQIAYQADLNIRNLNVHHFMPRDSIYTVTADVSLNGQGTDFFAPSSRLDAKASIASLHYGSWHLTDIVADAVLKDGRAVANIDSHNELADGHLAVDALLSTKKLDATVSADLNRVDFHALRFADQPLEVGLCGHVDVSSDMKNTYRVQGYFSDLTVRDDQRIYRPTDITLDALTAPDTTWAHLSSGDIVMNMTASGGYERLLDEVMKLSDEASTQMKDRIIDQPKLLSMLPTMHIDLHSGSDNPLMTLLRSEKMSYRQMTLDLTTSPETGINGSGFVHGLVADSTRIDTIDFQIKTKTEGRMIKERHVSFSAHVQNNKRNPQFVFRAMLDGAVHAHGAVVGLRFYDEKERLGVRLGANAELLETGINLHLVPERPTVGYKEFNLNKDNYIFLGPKNRIKAKVDLIADDGTGVKIYSEDDSSNYLQDLTISLNKLNLGELTSVMPYYLPRMGGVLNGDFHVVQDEQEHFSVVSDMSVRDLSYENSQLGNLSTELIYLQKENDAHALEAHIMKDDEEVGLLSGTYYNEGEGRLDALFSMQRFPLALVNGFIPNGMMGLEGYGEGELTVKGKLKSLQVNGEVVLNDSYLVSVPYGIRLRFDDDPVRIVGSNLLLENFTLSAYNDNPLNIHGNIDFSNLDNITMNVRMRARDFQLINAKKDARSEAYGKAYVNFFGMLKGSLDNLSMRGRLDVLGNTDLAYILRDSPLTTDNQLNELVKFTDFNDSVQTVVKRPQLTGFNMDMTIDVSQGAHVIAYLNVDQTNYVDLMGGGTLRMLYTPADNLRLTGKYTLNNGEMKYSLPVIPLKTFTIQNGSYIEFTGDVMNPTLNITATEQVKATVNNESGVGRSVTFDCGVVITKTLADMGLEFTLDAPQDMTIHSELQTMTT